jgi:hypothetical protein
VGKHAAHILELQSSPRAFASRRRISRNALRVRSLLIATTLASALLTLIANRDIFEIDPHAIGDTKVLTIIAGGKAVHEADKQ